MNEDAVCRTMAVKRFEFIRGLTKEHTQLGIIISLIGNLISPIGDILCSWLSDSALPDSYIPNAKLDILSPIEDLISLIRDFISPIGDNIHNWGY